MGYPIPQSEAKYCLVKLASFFISDAKFIVPLWGREVNFNNTRAKELLGIEFHKTADSLNEMVESCIDQGILEDKRPK